MPERIKFTECAANPYRLRNLMENGAHCTPETRLRVPLPLHRIGRWLRPCVAISARQRVTSPYTSQYPNLTGQDGRLLPGK